MLEKISDDIILVGTAHISKKSVDEVTKAIETYQPDVVAVELCQRRYDSLTKKDQWENTPVTSLLKSNNAYYLLAQTFLSSIQRKLGKDKGVQPGSEMIEAMNQAKQHNLTVTDDVSFAELLNIPVKLIINSDINVKITTYDDYIFAKNLCDAKSV